MSVKIHHGPPGSYKTSGAVADDFVPAVLEGRHIITNVRGLSDPAKIREVLEERGKTVPETFKLTWLDSTDREQMEMLQRFWHWAPDGCFFLIDEVQEVWPKAMRDSHLKKLDYPGGQDTANADGRFLTIALAFEKHRHRNWDFVVTSPNINKVHSVVRSCAEASYKHKNLATLGTLFKGRYVEGYHAADTNGKPADFYTIRKKRIPGYVFKLYQSTATGKVTDTIAGQSIFKDPKVLGLLVFGGLVIVGVFSMGTPDILRKTLESPPAETDGQTDPETVPPDRPKPASGAPVHTAPVGSGAPPALAPRLRFLTAAQKITITGSYETLESGKKTLSYYLRVHLDATRYFDLTNTTIGRLGVVVTPLTPCFYELRAGSTSVFAYCEEVDPIPESSTALASAPPTNTTPVPE